MSELARFHGWTLLATASAALAAACGEVTLDAIAENPANLDGASGATGTGGSAASGGTGGLPAFTACPLVPNETGWVDGAQNACQVQGPWYSYNDCTLENPTNCTQNQLPTKGSFPNVGGRMCTTGVTAAPLNQEEASSKWGAGIALNLNQVAESQLELTIGMLPVVLRGVRFKLTSNVPEIRVNFPTPSTRQTAHFVTVGSGEHTVYFADAVQGPWVPDPTPLNPSYIMSVQFQVPTTIGQSTAFEYCVEDLTAVL